ncbi:hypothetical protein [Streptantibioticus ferralitis]|uniref:Uncharacterized protein n=1 Tax=Streptantibioticus ferralitis TaxID=236510 RepID=A0ABT5Z1C6_9ACTN|nr:hypothetical protein [Streptantibioticus ferralitis]MDF2257644.1 hypothetical protein [Streptantibioticus ferralitis]
MSEEASPGRRFGTEFVRAQRAQHGKKTPEQRELSYDIAVNDEYAPWRDWLDEQLALLSKAEADALAGKLWYDEHFWAVINELAVGCGLRAAGLEIVYEQRWGTQTPDWTVLAPDGQPACLVEVHTDSPTKETYGQMRAWSGLAMRLRTIPVPIVLTLAPMDTPPVPPSPQEAKKIAQYVRREIMQPWRRNYFTCLSYTFLVMGDRRTGSLAQSPLGMAACFEPPSCLAGEVSAHRAAEKAEEKAKKYRTLQQETGLPLVAAIGAHRFTGLGLEQLDNLLAGNPTMTLQFNAGDAYLGKPIQIDLNKPRKWQMPSDLAGVLWVGNQFPFGDLAWRPNPRAVQRVPEAMSQLWLSRERQAPKTP